MGTAKSYQDSNKIGASTFALLIDDINKMSESEQKSLWLQINKEKVSQLAKELDISVKPNNFSDQEIARMINEGRRNGNLKKKN